MLVQAKRICGVCRPDGLELFLTNATLAGRVMLSTSKSCGCVSAAALNWAYALWCSHNSLGLQIDGVLVIGVQRLAFLLLEHPSVPTRVQVRQQWITLQRRTALLIANNAGARRPADVALLLGGAARG